MIKIALFAVAAFLVGCVTEPGPIDVIDCRGIETREQLGSDSTAVMEQYCGTEEK